MMEAHLKQRLLLAKRSWKEVSSAMLNSLIAMATEEELLAIDEGDLSIAGSVYSAKQLRNSASHFSAWAESPTEEDATRALILLVCYSGWIFSKGLSVDTSTEKGEEVIRAEDDEWWAANIDDAPVTLASQRLAHIVANGSASEAEVGSLCERIALSGSPASILTAINRLSKYSGGSNIIDELLNESFANVLANAGRGRARQVIELANRCGTLGYPHHARALRCCLPQDGAALGHYLARSPRRFVHYLAAVRDADPRGLAKLLSRAAEREPVVKSLANRVEDPKYGLKIVCQVAALLPRAAVREFLETPQFAGCVASRDTWELVFPLRLMATKSLFQEDFFACRETLDELKSRAEGPIKSFETVPSQLHESGLAERLELRPVIDRVLKSVTASDEEQSVQQILWDVAQYFPSYQHEVKRVALSSLVERPMTMSGWPRLCILGMLETLECSDIPAVSISDVDIAVRDLRQHRWELFRVALACLRTGTDLAERSASILAAARELMSSEPNSELGAKLLTDVRYALEARA